MSTAAGWYPDPTDPSQRRYWDGTAWTEHVEVDPVANADPGIAAGAPSTLVPSPASSPAPGLSIAGIRTDLLTDQRYAEVGSGQRVTKQNARLLKVVLGEDLLARQGSMVAFQGAIDFDHEGSGMARFMKKAVTGEGLSLMRCTGHGELFLADRGHQVHIVHLEGGGLTVNGRSVLAFEPSLTWDIERVKGAGVTARWPVQHQALGSRMGSDHHRR